MIEIRRNDSVLEVRISAPVTAADYKDILVPALDEAIATSEHVRMLAVFDAKVSDYTFGAMVEDARMGLKHWRGFDRVAVVGAAKGLRHAIRAFSVLMPCPVMTFDAGQEDEARRWLEESLGSIHQTDLGNGVLHLKLIGKLDSKAYAEEGGDIDAFVRRNEGFRLLLDLREFDGWQGLGAIGDHLKLVRDHVGLVEKAAIVGDAGWQRMAQEVGKRILRKEARWFPADSFDAAKAWLGTA
ncbi:STAS/SEC14 domain-containing protein [Seohaeicola zhoushanensis]|uniref:STAS/SEC14 domain-containing protein n=1 Tax=Seohaeicola zhoushanensis TaxID=1569283 RepID=A0A8J3GTL6_9RHOB|nr:STAS/SEC14 domain-containing protein [Seohaeicola zhoushanensis]GHF33864.1 hypothetical protein GCM10017056_01610 [Seohaeicola zhoushanensis]